MLYKGVSESLDQLENLLEKEKIPCPKEIMKFNQSLKDCLENGRSLTEQEMGSIDPFLFPDAGMGWLDSLQYQLEGNNKKRFEEILKKFYELWDKS